MTKPERRFRNALHHTITFVVGPLFIYPAALVYLLSTLPFSSDDALPTILRALSTENWELGLALFAYGIAVLFCVPTYTLLRRIKRYHPMWICFASIFPFLVLLVMGLNPVIVISFTYLALAVSLGMLYTAYLITR